MSGTGSGPVGDAQSWAEVAAAGMTSFTSESHNILDKVEQKEAVMGEAAAHAAVSTKDSATHALHEAEASAAAAYSVVDNMRSSVADVVSSKGGDAAAAAQSSGTGKLQQSKESASAAITAVKSAGAAAADTVADADTKVTAAAKSTEERGTTAAEEALTQVGVASAALRSEVIKAKATLAPVVSPTDIKAAANAAMRASSVMEHLEQRSVRSMSTVKSKVNAAVVWLLVPQTAVLRRSRLWWHLCVSCFLCWVITWCQDLQFAVTRRILWSGLRTLGYDFAHAFCRLLQIWRPRRVRAQARTRLTQEGAIRVQGTHLESWTLPQVWTLLSLVRFFYDTSAGRHLVHVDEVAI